MSQRLRHELGVDALVQPGLGGTVAKGMQVMAAGDAGALRQSIHELAHAVGGQGATIGVEPQGVFLARWAFIQIRLNRLYAGLA